MSADFPTGASHRGSLHSFDALVGTRSFDAQARAREITARFDFEVAWAVADSSGIKESYGDIERVFPLASVTKLLTTWGIVIALEAGEFQLTTPAGPPGSTVRHLLAHTSGLPFSQGAVLSKPGERRVYSNRGIEVLGETLEAHTGMTIQAWIREKVLEPLGMHQTVITGSPAYGAHSTIHDLVIFAQELLSPRLVSSQAALATRTVQFPGIGGVVPGFGRQKQNDWGLGFEIRDHKYPHWMGETLSPRTFGHFGQAGSFLWVDPEVSKAGVFLGAEPFNDAHKENWPALTDAMRVL